MRLIPVLDLRAGVAVEARGGDRRYYRPLEGYSHRGCDPIAWAKAARDDFGAQELYAADLDAIETGSISRRLYDDLARIVPKLWLDPGARDAQGWERLPEKARLVVGTESWRRPAELTLLVSRLGASRIVLSLDLRDGRPLTADGSDWTDPSDPVAIARQAVDRGIEEIVLLDLARVGSNQGPGTLELLRAFRRELPTIRFGVGGGIAGQRDLVRLAELGASAVLIGSAWRSGTIPRAAWTDVSPMI